MMQRWIEHNHAAASAAVAPSAIASTAPLSPASGDQSSVPVVTLNEGSSSNASAPSLDSSSSASATAGGEGGGKQQQLSSLLQQQIPSASPSASTGSSACPFGSSASALRPEQVDRLLGAVRLPLMSVREIMTLVRPSGLFSPERLLDAIKVKDECRDTELNYRGVLLPEENVASQRHGAQVIRGEQRKQYYLYYSLSINTI